MAQIEILTAIDLDQMHNSPSLFDPSKDAHINYRLAMVFNVKEMIYMLHRNIPN
jgi:hypothetical protein